MSLEGTTIAGYGDHLGPAGWTRRITIDEIDRARRYVRVWSVRDGAPQSAISLGPREARSVLEAAAVARDRDITPDEVHVIAVHETARGYLEVSAVRLSGRLAVVGLRWLRPDREPRSGYVRLARSALHALVHACRDLEELYRAPAA